MTTTLDDICQSGSFCNAFVYHICGMPWAATNSLELKAHLDAAGPTSTLLRRKMFGGESHFDVQVLPILQHELGPQRIEYSEEKGITVGGWSVRLSSDPSGFVWQNGTNMEQWGVIGLDWQPETNAPGASHTVLAADVVPNLVDNTVTLTWPLGQDVGIKAWLDSKWTGSAYSENLYLYSSSSCFRPTAAPVVSGLGVSVACNSAQFNAPNESILSVEEGQSIYLTNYPQGIEGLTANLFGVQIADGGLVDGAGFGHEAFGHYPFGHTEPVEAGDIVTTGDTPIFLRSGKIKANATTDNTGRWSISMGGVTDQLKFKSNTRRFNGSLYGYEFNRTQSPSLGGQVAYAPYDIAIRENYDDVITPTALTFLTLGDPNRNSATSKGDLRQQILDALNGWGSSKCVFHASADNDIVWEESTATVVKSVYVSGPAISAAGLGYIGYERIPTWLKTLSDPLNNNVGQSILSDHGEPTWNGGLPTETSTTLNETVAMCLRPLDVVDSVFRDGETNTLDVLGLVRNRATFEYYIGYDNSKNNVPAQNYTNNLRLTEKVPMAVPQNAAGDQILKISKGENAEISLAIGDVIGFGAWSNGDNIYGQVSGISGDEITFLANTIYGMPSAFYYCKDLPELLRGNTVYQDQIQAALDKLNSISASGTELTTVEDAINLFEFGDLFRVADITAVSSTDPTAILKQLIGDPDTDTGLSNAMIQTSIKNMFERGDALSFVPFIDWDKLDELMAVRNLPDAQYVFSLDKQDSTGTDWMAMFNGVLLTHGIEMTYEYTETYRCWWISFKLFNEGNLASATIGGNTIDDTDIASNEVQGQSGGGWYYSRIASTYKSINGEEVNLSFKMRNGRIGNTLKDRTLTVKDNMTLLPIDYAAPASIIEDTHFPNMLYQFSRVVYNQKLILKMKKAARVGVGLWSSATWSPLLHRITGRRNAGSLSGEVSAMVINLTSMTIEADIMTSAGGGLAIGPSIDISSSAKFGDVITFTASKTVSENVYQDPADGLTDLAWFGCFKNVAGVVSARDCGCTGFRVTVFERNPSSRQLFYDPDYLYASQNVWRGTMQTISIDDVSGAGTTTVDITLDGNGTAYDTGKEYVAVFADRADDALQPCQTDLFGWLGNSSGKVVDSDTNESIAIMVDS